MGRQLPLLLALVAVLLGPILLRPKQPGAPKAGELSLVLNGNTLQTTGVGSLAMNIAGTALNSFS